jgi:hypothetical protein
MAAKTYSFSEGDDGQVPGPDGVTGTNRGECVVRSVS